VYLQLEIRTDYILERDGRRRRISEALEFLNRIP
jgi:hypothetical protein